MQCFRMEIFMNLQNFFLAVNQVVGSEMVLWIKFQISEKLKTMNINQTNTGTDFLQEKHDLFILTYSVIGITYSEISRNATALVTLRDLSSHWKLMQNLLDFVKACYPSRFFLTLINLFPRKILKHVLSYQFIFVFSCFCCCCCWYCSFFFLFVGWS